MADNNREFILTGKFDDQITKKLQEINKQVETLGKSFAANTKFIDSQTKSVSNLTKSYGDLSRSLGNVENSVKKTSRGVEEIGSSAKKAKEESERLLDTLVKFESIKLIGTGIANGLAEGAQKTINLLERGMAFLGDRFSEGVKDQLGDIMARGSLYGSLTKEEMFGKPPSNLTKDQQIDRSDALYNQTKNISRAMDNSINDIIRTSTASSEVIQVLSRQLGDNFLPAMLKEKGITDLSTVSREKLNAVMGGENGVGKQLATLYSQMASVIPTPSYAPQAARGLTQFLGAGTIDRQLAIFEQNPVLVDALKDGLKKFGNTVSGRIKAAAYGFSIAMPEAALEEAKNSIAGGMQSVHDTLLGPSGILTFTADQGQSQSEKTLAMMKKSGVYDMQINDLRTQDAKRLEAYKNSGKTATQVEAYRKEQLITEARYAKRLTNFYLTADSPIEIIATVIGPLLQDFADMLNSAGNLFIGPVNEIVGTMAPTLAQLRLNFRNLGSDIRGNKRTLAEALGRGLAEVFKNLAMLFDPKGLGGKANSAIDKFFADFKKGFESIDGKQYVDKVMKGLTDMIVRLFLNEGNIFKGTTPLGDLLLKVFLLLSTGPVALGIASALGVIATNSILKLGESIFKKMFVRQAAAATPWAAGAAGEAAAGGGAMAAAAAPVALIAGTAAIAVGTVVYQKELLKVGKDMEMSGKNLSRSSDYTNNMMGNFLIGESKHIIGFTNAVSGLWDTITAVFSGDSKKATVGMERMLNGIMNAIEGVGNTTINGMPAMAAILTRVIQTLFTAIGNVIQEAWSHRPTLMGGDGLELGQSLNYAEGKHVAGRDPNTGKVIWKAGGGLGDALSSELRNKPSGSNLVIANSSETIIPAAGGLGMKELFRTLDERSMGTINAPITIHQQPGQNAEQLAALVAMELGNAIRHARASSVYV